LRTNLIKQLCISLALPLGIIYCGFLFNWQESAQGSHDKIFLAISNWLLWGAAMLAKLSGTAVASENIWLFAQLPPSDLLIKTRKSFLHVFSVWLAILNLPVIVLLFYLFPLAHAVRVIIFAAVLVLIPLILFVRTIKHIPFTSRLLPDHWQLNRFWLFYLILYILSVFILANLLELLAYLSWLKWFLFTSTLIILVIYLRKKALHLEEGWELIFEKKMEPIFLSIDDGSEY
jgi:hypothetical protein